LIGVWDIFGWGVLCGFDMECVDVIEKIGELGRDSGCEVGLLVG
jgi:hypothetical protein